jgi:hypothetical protein
MVQQLPARDAMAEAEIAPPPPEETITTATYRGTPRRPARR